MPRAALPALCLLAVALVACGSGSEPDQDRLSLPILKADGGSATLRVEVAETDDELSRGLSNRPGLDRDAGMLFVIEERRPAFWMKDVSFPLSVAFIESCGRIIELQDMEAQSLALHQSEGDYRFGLEANKGWFREHGVGPGDMVELPKRLRPAGCPDR